MRFGIHLPLIGWPGRPPAPGLVLEVAERAEQAGFTTLAANDHLVYDRPWLDGLSALAAVAARTTSVRLITSVALPVIRGPFALAKAFAAIDLLSAGRLTAGMGPGSSARDYDLVGIPFAERWSRFDEAVQAVRSLLRPGPPFAGRFYSTEGIAFEPTAVQPGGPPIWIGSWGSHAGLARVARLADGWLASAYNTTPGEYASARARLDEAMVVAGREERLPAALATMWLAITPSRAAGRRVLERVIAPMLSRPVEALDDRLLVGPESLVVDRLAEYAAVGLDEVLVWPVTDDLAQLDRFAERIMPSFVPVP